MCGIAGIISARREDVTVERIRKMTDIIAHRGPDGDGQWISANGKVGLGHRRLSIIDLHVSAGQPMHYLDRYTIVFNGEIYNYIELKEILEKQGYKFKTSSDTEVLMAMYDKYKEGCLQYLDGMYSFVVYDEKEESIFCTRDRFGEKPFFYSYKQGEYFIFGSEMKALWAAGIKKEVNEKMLYQYLSANRLENTADPGETFYKNCYRLPQSHSIKISLKDFTLNIAQYYDINWKNIDNQITEKKAEERFRELFYQSVNLRLRSDVPVGSSLSGGLDSSLVVTVIDELKKQSGSSQIQKTFSAVFPGFAKDESKYMQMVIDKTNVEPHFVTPEDEGMIRDLDKLVFHQEEPFASASIYVQYCVMKLAREHNVTVLLDGQGADEILAGYHGYFPLYFTALQRNNPSAYKKEFDLYRQLHADNRINSILEDNPKQKLINKVKASFPGAINTLKSLYGSLSPGKNEQLIDRDFAGAYRKSLNAPYLAQSLNEALYINTFKSGIQELLRYADRNSMAHSREVRLPFLNHELVEFLFTLPDNFKIRSGWTKWIMRQSFKPELPEQITWRKDKIGYEPPQKSWMNAPEVLEKIRDGREKLVKEQFLNKSILQQNTVIDSKEEQDRAWTQLMAAQLLA
jgi:asparagine synthase (glutamine-hydrolysing)